MSGFAPMPIRREWTIRRVAPGTWDVTHRDLHHSTCGRWETAMYIATGDSFYRRWWLGLAAPDGRK